MSLANSPKKTNSSYRARKIERFFNQTFFVAEQLVAEQFTGKKGVYTKISETLKSFDDICEGKGDDCPNKRSSTSAAWKSAG